ncbi:MAG: hypothetical protein EOP45_17285 [Sphingobacteriaceae bacterium]|nr:MAG: hypothetical protein EOP45_17285 [Sphingobacteriaceae bacterium]
MSNIYAKSISNNEIQSINYTTSIQFYGDSITTGAGVTTVQRWTNRLASTIGSTEINQGVSGMEWTDCNQKYLNVAPTRGQTTFIALGTNDAQRNQVRFDHTIHAQKAAIAFLALPTNNFIDVRSSSAVTKAGTWTNTGAFIYGLRTTDMTGGSTLTFTITGNILMISNTILSGWNSSQYINMQVIVNGSVLTNWPLIHSLNQSQNGYAYPSFLFLYDFGSSATRTIVLKPSQQGSTPSGNAAEFYVDWVAGYDSNTVTGGSQVIVPEFGYIDITKLGTIPSVANMEALKIMQKRACRELGKTGLNVFYLERANGIPYGMMLDGLHPNSDGHAKIARDTLQLTI